MTKNAVTFKGEGNSIIIQMKKDCKIQTLEKELAQKLNKEKNIFENSTLTLSFEGKKLKKSEYEKLKNVVINSVMPNTKLVFDNEKQELKYTKSSIYYHYGSLHAGQTITCESDIVIIGNVNPGAEVYSSGNITVCGRANGMLYAGTDGNNNAVISARSLNPSYISIGNYKAHGTKTPLSDDISAELAKVDNENITIVNIV